eukprot:10010291-Lingulodinium_polyedra.AAC.1
MRRDRAGGALPGPGRPRRRSGNRWSREGRWGLAGPSTTARRRRNGGPAREGARVADQPRSPAVASWGGAIEGP